MEHEPIRTAGRPTAKDSAALDAFLLTIAFDEFVEHGFAGASLSRIVDRARISKTTLYSRYPSKTELFREVVRRQIDSERPHRALHRFSDRTELGPGLESFVIEMLTASFEHQVRSLNRVILSEVHHFPELAAAANERLQRGIERITAFLEFCCTSQEERIDNPREVAEAFIHMIRGWYLDRLIGGHDASRDEIRTFARQAVRTLIRSGPSW